MHGASKKIVREHCQQECATRGAHPTPPHLRTSSILVGRTHEAKLRTDDVRVQGGFDARQDQVKLQTERASNARAPRPTAAMSPPAMPRSGHSRLEHAG